MSDNLSKPLAHLRLDRVDASGYCPDSGENGHHGIVVGNPKLLPDDRFAGVLRFAGTAAEPEYLRLDGLVYQPTEKRSGGAISISLWLRTTQGGGALCSCDGDAWWELSLAADGTLQWLTHDIEQQTDRQASVTRVVDGHWHHVAVSFDPHQGQKSISVDGRGEAISMRRQSATMWARVNPDGSVAEGMTPAVTEFALSSDQIRDVLVGATPTGDRAIKTASLFKGDLAALRLFAAPLPIGADVLMAADQQSGFRASHPLDIAFSDDNEASVIVITDDPRAQILHLDLRNTSPWPLQLKVPAHSHPGADHHHFELRWRPGVLSRASLAGSIKLRNSPDWAISAPVVQPDRSVCLFFLRTASEATELAAAAVLRLTLEGISADAGHGAHGTRVEAGFGKLLGQQHASIASGKRIKHLSVVNHSGKRHVPLHLGVVGSNRILNDGKSANHLRLHLTNTSRDETLYLNPASAEARTRLMLTFVFQDDLEMREWALCTESQATSITVHTDDIRSTDEPVGAVALGAIPLWNGPTNRPPHRTGLPLSEPLRRDLGDRQKLILRTRSDDQANIRSNDMQVSLFGDRAAGTAYIEVLPFAIPPPDSLLLIPGEALAFTTADGDQSRHWSMNLGDKRQLSPGESLTIDIRGIVTSLPSGATRGYLHYENLPGHWDGTLTFELQKSTLTETDQRIGIGTDLPNAPLHIAARRDGATDATPGSGGLLQLGPTEGANLLLDDNELMARNGGKVGTLYLQADGGELRIHNNQAEQNRVVVTADGSLGIGTTNPSNSAMLEVQSTRGQSKDQQLRPARISVNDTASRNGVSIAAGEYGPAVHAGGGHLKIFTTSTDTADYNVEVYRLDPQGIKLTQGAPRGAMTVKAVSQGREMYSLYTDNSAARYKESIQPLADDFARILLTRPRSYRFRNADAQTPPSIGYLAEELHDLGLGALVIYDAEGRPDGVEYDKICLYLTEVVKDQARQIEQLERQLQASQENRCSGVAQLDAGHASIELPAGFVSAALALNQPLQVTLTPRGAKPFMLSYLQPNPARLLVSASVPSGEFGWAASCSAPIAMATKGH